MILTLRTLIVLLATALLAGGTVFGVNKILAGTSDNGTDYGLDTNDNSKFDWLVVEATVDLPEAGNWAISAGLLSPTAPTGGSCGGPYPVPLLASPADIQPIEWSIAWTYETYFFPSGTQTIRMAFQGTDIFRSGVDGPYVVRASFSVGGYPCPYCMYSRMPEPWPAGTYVTWNHTTNAYRATDFDEPFRPAYFSGGHSDVGVDVDQDGLDDFLELRADVHVNSAGTYNLNGFLSSGTAPTPTDPTMPVVYTTVAYGYRDVTLQAGDTSVYLRFRGDQIRMAGIDGPWDFSLTLYGPNDIMYMNGTVAPPTGGSFAPVPVYPETLCGETSAYPASAFDDTVELLSFTGNFEEIAEDWNGDGLYEALMIRAEVDVFVIAGFDVRGTLQSGDGTRDIAFGGTQTYLSEGLGWVDTTFPGPEVRASAVDGPYRAVLSVTPVVGGFDPATTYMTRAYHATDFAAGYTNRTGYWIGDLAARSSGSGGLGIYFSVVRGQDQLTYVVEDIATTSVIDASGTTVWSTVDKVYLPSGGASQSFSYALDGLASGSYTIVVTLGPSDQPVDRASISVTV